jgi:shikimate dehydrogenase
MGIDGTYSRQEVAPDNLRDFVAGLHEAGFVGCNVTVPHKEAAYRLVRIDDDATRRLGAVNTIFIQDRQTFGINTDGYGFTANLAQQLPKFSPAGKSVLLLGSGGAARAICGALLERGVAQIRLANRTAEKAHQLRESFGSRVVVVPWSSVEDWLAEADLFVNSTSLGMKGKPDLAISLARLPRTSGVCDIVYVPLETALLHQAREHGHPVVDGLGMLLHQAQPGFERWFGVRPEVTAELRRLVEDDIKREFAPVRGRS